MDGTSGASTPTRVTRSVVEVLERFEPDRTPRRGDMTTTAERAEGRPAEPGIRKRRYSIPVRAAERGDGGEGR